VKKIAWTGRRSNYFAISVGRHKFNRILASGMSVNSNAEIGKYLQLI
jgi:hypothetical protein